MILSTLGNYDSLKRVLDGYDRQTSAAGSFELIVVTDAADPDPNAVQRAIGERSFPVRRITGPEPGLSSNRNAGMKVVSSPLILFTDNDTIPVPKLISEHLKWHLRYPDEHTAVLGRVRWARELPVTTFMRWLDTGIQFDFANIRGIEAGWGRFAGANVSLKTHFAQTVGEFDQEHFPYGYEDTDWAYRASKLGFRLLYNRRATVDHLRPMTLEFWQRRARRIAQAERTFVELHPEVPPWFYDLFRRAASEPPARGRGIKLAPFVPRATPWLGPYVWNSVDLYYRQSIAPHFLEAWDSAANGPSSNLPPDLSEFSTDGEP